MRRSKKVVISVSTKIEKHSNGNYIGSFIFEHNNTKKVINWTLGNPAKENSVLRIASLKDNTVIELVRDTSFTDKIKLFDEKQKLMFDIHFEEIFNMVKKYEDPPFGNFTSGVWDDSSTEVQIISRLVKMTKEQMNLIFSL